MFRTHFVERSAQMSWRFEYSDWSALKWDSHISTPFRLFVQVWNFLPASASESLMSGALRKRTTFGALQLFSICFALRERSLFWVRPLMASDREERDVKTQPLAFHIPSFQCSAAQLSLLAWTFVIMHSFLFSIVRLILSPSPLRVSFLSLSLCVCVLRLWEVYKVCFKPRSLLIMWRQSLVLCQ